MGTWRDQGGAQQGQQGPTMGAGQGMPQSMWQPSVQPAGTGGFKPSGPTMGYSQGSPLTMGAPGNTGIVPPGTPRMPTMPGMTPGIFAGGRMGGGGGLNNPSSRMPNPQSNSGTGPGIPQMGFQDAIAGGMANGWDASAGPQGSYAQILLNGGNPAAALAAMTPEQKASWQKYAAQQTGQANSNYGAGMADGTFGQGSLALQRDGVLNAFKGWY